MKLFMFTYHLVCVYVIAETKEEAIEKMKEPDSVVNKEYHISDYDNPDYWEESDTMITHFGWD